MDKFKFVVYVPVAQAEQVRAAIGSTGAGQIGNYSFCSFSSIGIARYQPGEGSNPAIGAVGKYEAVNEERIEVTCYKNQLKEIIEKVRKAHPYEEVAYDVYPLHNI